MEAKVEDEAILVTVNSTKAPGFSNFSGPVFLTGEKRSVAWLIWKGAQCYGKSRPGVGRIWLCIHAC